MISKSSHKGILRVTAACSAVLCAAAMLHAPLGSAIEAAAANPGAELFVAPDGDDSNSGNSGKFDVVVPVSCGEHEVVSGDDCVCDNRADYYGTAGNCILCKGTHKVWKESACVCDDGFGDDKSGGCKLKCAEIEIENNGACICDNDAGYYGASGNCMLCAGEHRAIMIVMLTRIWLSSAAIPGSGGIRPVGG